MEEENVYLSIPITVPLESLLTTVKSLNLNQLLKTREHIGTLIDKLQSQEGDDELISESEVDYDYLQELLANGNWEKADEETSDLMLEAVQQNEIGIMFVETARSFPASDLKTIDRLWTKYSNGRFGFSVQQRLWKEVGEDIEKFGETIGWRLQNRWIEPGDLKFTYEAPLGHLPFVRRGICREVEVWSTDLFTDSEGMDQVVDSVESVESIEMWKVFIDLLKG